MFGGFKMIVYLCIVKQNKYSPLNIEDYGNYGICGDTRHDFSK